MRLLFLLLFLLVMPCFAAERLLEVDTRQDIEVPVFYIRNDGASATVVLLSGGQGGMGQIVEGQPTSKNFLVRSRQYFAEAGLNVAVLGLPVNKKTGHQDFPNRLSPEHLQDIRKVVEYFRAETGLPVWLVGTSRGTVSATAAAIDFGNELLGGVVLTSSIVSYKETGAVPRQDLHKIQIPVLVLHHENDLCAVCAPYETPNIIKGLKNAPIKKLTMVSGGEMPTGNPCEALHYHGFIGIEKTTVEIISTWIKNPVP